jgi:hypothetical protein
MAIDVPAFISRNAERGLEYNREGKGGDGLVEQTLEDARDMVRGSISEAKVRKMGPWFARHKVDMEAPANKPDNEDFPGKGAVAWLLWGGSTSGDKMDAAKWAERIVEKLDRESAFYSRPTFIDMDTIEARLTAALAEASAKDAEVAEARTAVEKIASDNIELTAKVAELTAALESLNAEKAVAVAAVEAAVESSVSASVEAAKIAASVGVAPVESAPDAEPKGSILEQYMALSGSDRSRFFDANAVAIRAALRK